MSVAGSEFIVSRTVEKRLTNDKTNEKSTYHVDKVVKTYTEVQNLLKGYGVDLDHKRFLILQVYNILFKGEVESIALMKPKGQGENEDGLLEYLEDIIGTSSLKQPINEAEQQLEKLTENQEEKLSHLKLVQKETRTLEVHEIIIIDAKQGGHQVCRV